MELVQSWISNIAFPTSTEELLFVLRNGGLYDTEVILHETSGIRWTAPRWARKGDVVFFMHSVSAINKIRMVEKQLCAGSARYIPEEITLMSEGLKRARDIYKAYGGRIIGAARLGSDPTRGVTEPIRHWRTSTYAVIADTCAFEKPLERSAFRGFIPICRTGSVTPLYGTQYSNLRECLLRDNTVPAYILDSESDPGSLGGVNARNWYDSAGRSVRSFDTEEQFRACWADYMLKAISTNVFRECRCVKTGIPDSFADNIILIGGKYLPVEVKIRWEASAIKDQLWKYCNNDRIELKNSSIGVDRIWSGFSMLVSPEVIALYNAATDTLQTVYRPEDVRPETIEELKTQLLTRLREAVRSED